MPAINPLTPIPVDPAVVAANIVLGVPDQLYIPWQTAMYQLWKNPGGKTPQQVLDSLGSQAGSAMAASAALVANFNTYGRPALVTKVNALVASLVKPFTVNDDGTVTINA